MLGVTAATLRYWERCYPRMRPFNFDVLKRRRYSGEELLRIVIVHRLINGVGMKVHSAADLTEKLDVRQFWLEIERANIRTLPNSRVGEWILAALSIRLLGAVGPLLDSHAVQGKPPARRAAACSGAEQSRVETCDSTE